MATTITKYNRIERTCDRCKTTMHRVVDVTTGKTVSSGDGSIEDWEWTGWSTIRPAPSVGNPLATGETELCAYCLTSFQTWMKHPELDDVQRQLDDMEKRK